METLVKGLSSTEALRQVQIGFAVSTATDAAKSDPDQARDP
jgi:hypothetical protein